jgi:reactive intermediate/imine deaminase
MAMSLDFIHPEGLARSSQYTQVVAASGTRTVFVSGQVALDGDGELIGKDDFEAQAHKAFENVRAALEAAGAGMKDVTKLTIYVTDMKNLGALGRVRAQYFAGRFPASTLIEVSMLVLPDLLVEVEAIAVLE